MRRVGKNVKRLRIARKLTQEDMRDHGFNYRYFQRIESGEVNLTLELAVRMANTFQRPLTEIATPLIRIPHWEEI